MRKANIENNLNVVKLSDYRKISIQNSSTKNEDFKSYLKLLSLNDLINESNHLNKQILQHPITNKMSNKTQTILDEVNSRLEDEEDSFSKSLLKIKQGIENRLAQLQSLL